MAGLTVKTALLSLAVLALLVGAEAKGKLIILVPKTSMYRHVPSKTENNFESL